MRLAVMTEPQQGLSYDDLSRAVRHAEAEGFEAFFRSDHYGSFPGADDHPTTDAWSTLAGLARETSRIRLGTLVSPVTFRLPGPFAKAIATIDEMSGGRIEVGVGSGWNEREHAQYGIPFPPVAERFEMLEEELRILHGLWREPDGWSFEGRHWRVDDALVRPKPVQQPHPPIILGAGGKPRSIRLAARWADEYNVSGPEVSDIGAIRDALRAACEAEGRPPGSVVLSAMAGIVVGANDAQVRERIDRMLIAFGMSGTDADRWVASRRKRYLIGTPDAVLERMRDYAAAGVERLMLQDWLPTDLDMLSLLAREVMPQA
jgi:F420-dependent oxidoreductase-like protein